ncbi:14094_t:CDS:2 [Funneliformis geosporum]|nr:14094_t:CDS:2 [Funneliformis geosporum]
MVVFRLNRIKPPFEDKEKIKEWKISKENIIMSDFPSDKKLTHENAIWTKSVLKKALDVE